MSTAHFKVFVNREAFWVIIIIDTANEVRLMYVKRRNIQVEPENSPSITLIFSLIPHQKCVGLTIVHQLRVLNCYHKASQYRLNLQYNYFLKGSMEVIPTGLWVD